MLVFKAAGRKIRPGYYDRDQEREKFKASRTLKYTVDYEEPCFICFPDNT